MRVWTDGKSSYLTDGPGAAILENALARRQATLSRRLHGRRLFIGRSVPCNRLPLAEFPANEFPWPLHPLANGKGTRYKEV